MIELTIASIVFFNLGWNVGGCIAGALATYLWWREHLILSYLQNSEDE